MPPPELAVKCWTARRHAGFAMLLREIRGPKVKVGVTYLVGLYQVTMSISITCKWTVCEAQSILILGRSEGMPPSLVALRIDVS